ncbi:MAG: BamA/TamA family outer membrane protein [Cyclobacteriaceae bacterium]
MKRYFSYSLFFLLFFIFVAPTFGQRDSDRRIVLVGDAGELTEGRHLVMEAIKKWMTKDSEDSPTDFLFLGDNIYPRGMPKVSEKSYQESVRILGKQTEAAVDLNGNLYMIPGNHDWEQGRPDGLQAILRQQTHVDSLNLPNIYWLPRDGCPGPVEVQINEEIVLVVIDSQWWLHPFEKPGEFSDCEFKSKDEILASLKDAIEGNKDKWVLLALHHPVRTFGEHNGGFSIKDHLFPLSAVVDHLYFPLPLIGSIYPLYRSYFGSYQDQAHPLYRSLIKAVDQIVQGQSNVILVSGHEHAMQYLQEGDVHFVVAGSGSKATRLKRKNPLEFGSAERGFAVLDFLDDRNVTLKFYGLQTENPLYAKTLSMGDIPKEDDFTVVNTTPIDTVRTAITYQYQASRFKQKLLGNNYRREWEAEVVFPVIDLRAKNLEIIKRGGGMQTKSLRMADRDTGEEFVLRSINKYPALAIPEKLRKTVARDIVQDQIAASHPYGALIIPPLAEAMGVYHSSPKLVWLPNSPLLKNHGAEFGNNVYLFEKRFVHPSSMKKEDYKSFTTHKMIAAIRKDNDYIVIQEEVLRARVLDLLIGDWDRHDDQWTWVGVETKKGREYLPVPRDRDQAFFVNEGLIPKIASKDWIMPKLQGFDHDLRNINGFMFNARYFDRSFLNGLEKDTWENVLNEVVGSLTDQVLEDALENLPDTLQSLQAAEMLSKLKSRRAWLKEKALEYYDFLAEEVDVVGSNKSELFEITHFESGNIQVSVSKISKKGNVKQTLLERTFRPEETKEIRLFGIGGEDTFQIDGKGPGKIKIRLVSGEDPDSIENNAIVANRSLIIYQWEKERDVVNSGKGSKIILSEDEAVFDYNRNAFRYEKRSPLPSFEYNADDGIYIGTGFQWVRHGFRKDPYRLMQSIKGNVAFLTGAFNFYYRGHAVDVINRWDVEWKADVLAPNYINNFFGFGNETGGIGTEGRDKDFYRVRFNRVNLGAFLRREIGQFGHLSLGPVAEYTQLDDEDNDDRFINDAALSRLNTFEINQRKIYSGVKLNFELDKRDNPKLPSRGLHFLVQMKHLEGLNTFSKRINKMNAELSLYWTFKEASRFTWATRFGGGHTFGEFEFFQAQHLGGNTNFRGLRRFRFSGESVVFANTELRMRFNDVESYILPFSTGMLLFHDLGRVWWRDENSQKWHRSIGLGFWVAPLDQLVVTAVLGISEEEILPAITFGFQF